MKHKILLVDDDKNISEILEFNLMSEGYEVVTAFSAEQALKNDLSEFHIILLDVMMDGMSGYKMAETIRKKNIQIPIIFLTAKGTENDMLTGFSVGGDDYISKPFSIKEVIARVKAVLKRGSQSAIKVSNKLTISNFIIDYDLKDVSIDGTKIELTKTEFELLNLLAKHPERVFTREEIIDDVWKDTPFITERTVDVHITRLRKRLGSYSGIITNRTGFGYRFNIAAL